MQQYRYPVGARYWEFPQGSWETNPGTNPERVALAELEEETGYRAKALIKLGHLYEAYGFSNQGFHVFLAAGLEPGHAKRDRTEQDMQTKKFNLVQIHELIAAGEIKDAPSIAALRLLAIFEHASPSK